MISILKLTYYEYVKRRVFVVSIILYALVIMALLFGIGRNIDYLISRYFLSFLFYLTLLFLIFSGFDTIPRMVEDGSIELLLSRPIGRVRLILYKYVATLLVVPICTFLFLLLISIIYFISTGTYNPVFLSIYIFTSLTFAVYYAAVLPLALLFYRSNLNLLICLALIVANVLPNIINWITVGHVELTKNYMIGFFYIISPRLVELCGLAINAGSDSLMTLAYSAIYISLCMAVSFIIICRKDF